MSPTGKLNSCDTVSVFACAGLCQRGSGLLQGMVGGENRVYVCVSEKRRVVAGDGGWGELICSECLHTGSLQIKRNK